MSGAEREEQWDETPRSVEQALRDARDHARLAASEAILALRAVLDAASLIASGRPANTQPALEALARRLDEFSRGLAGGNRPVSGALISAILDALDEEIRRWEGNSADDEEARAVLRAFLGLREILWEFGVRREDSADGESATPSARPSRTTSERKRGGRGKPRVQKVPIDT